jgi:hypothetical protein
MFNKTICLHIMIKYFPHRKSTWIKGYYNNILHTTICYLVTHIYKYVTTTSIYIYIYNFSVVIPLTEHNDVDNKKRIYWCVAYLLSEASIIEH